MAGEVRPPKSTLHSDELAKKRFANWGSVDPYPEIDSSLLNSADVHDYIEATGMLFPFDPAKIKSSSYEIMFGYQVIYWDEDGNKKTKNLKKGESFCVKPNSLVFIVPEQKIRLPDYIAIRFNLRINIVHKGLLLGTGPLVDPGFEGHLLIPLHNFTQNEYYFAAGGPFVWVEFTKISNNNRWLNSGKKKPPKRMGKYIPFKENKKNKDANYYLYEAFEGNPIHNATPLEIANLNLNIANVKKTANFASISIFALAFTTVLAVWFGVAPLIQSSSDIVKDVNALTIDAQKDLDTHEMVNTMTIQSINDINARLVEIQNELQSLKIAPDLKGRVATLEKEIAEIQNLLETLLAKKDTNNNAK